jgi:hypothetical protein
VFSLKYILPLLTLFQGLVAQQGTACLSELESYLEQNSKIPPPKDGQVYEMKYFQEAVSQKGVEEKRFDLDFSVRMGHNKMIIESGRLSIYVDPQDIFYIEHDQKLIYWSQGYDTLSQVSNPFQLLEQQQKILQNCLVEGCRIVEKDGRKLQEIKLRANSTLRNNLKLSGIVIWYDLIQKRIYQVRTDYGPDSEITGQLTTYSKINFHGKGKVMTNSYSLVFNNKGVLHKQFTDYSLIDNKH